jgi:cephalosporin-C deacetylase-like acetyl esterase
MKTPIAFSYDGSTLRGSLQTPDAPVSNRYPLVIMSQGLGTLHEWAQPTVDVLTEAGIACLTFDYRGFGISDGEPRQEANPWKLVHDLRAAIDFAHTLSQIDSDRIALWGSCYGGGVTMVAAAVDRRVKAVVTQVPLVSGYGAMRSLTTPEVLDAICSSLDSDRVSVISGEPRIRLTQTTLDPSVPALAYDQETYDWMTGEAAAATPHWVNQLTLQTVAMMLEFEPGEYLARLGGKPLLMIVADDDTICPADLAVAAYERVDGPKQLIHLEGDHYCVYQDQFDLVAKAARDWFIQHLLETAVAPEPALV